MATGSRRTGRVLLLVIAAALVVVVALLLRTTDDLPVMPREWRWGSFAVLPPTGGAGSDAEPWLTGFIQEAMETSLRSQARLGARLLARPRMVEALARTSQELPAALQAAQVGRYASTPWVLDATYSIRERTVTVELKVIRADNGRVGQQATRVGQLDDSEALADQVAGAVSRLARDTLALDEPIFMADVLTESPGARQLFLQAQREHATRDATAESCDRLVALLDRALAEDPGFQPARQLRSAVLEQRFLLRRDPADLDRAISETEPLAAAGSVTAQLRLCKLQRWRDDVVAALAACEAVRTSDPQRAPHAALAELLLELGRDAEAARALERALELQPHVGWHHLRAARHSLDRGLVDEALRLARRAAELQDAEHAAGEFAPARLEGWPPLSGAHALHARAAFLDGQDEAALAAAELEACLVLRLVAIRTGEADLAAEARAREDALRAALLGPTPGPGRILPVARIYTGLDDVTALAICRQGLERAPADPGLNLLAAIASQRTGDAEAAVDYLKTARRERRKRCGPCASAMQDTFRRATRTATP